MPESGESSVTGVDVDGLRRYLAATGIEFAILFGSHARGTATEDSDVDVALRFPEDIDSRERFRRRNRIDAELQAYADGDVDVSDIDALPEHVAHAALQEGVPLTGDQDTIDAYRQAVEAAYEASNGDRERERREIIERLARGDV